MKNKDSNGICYIYDANKFLTVKDLIEELKKYDPDEYVYTLSDCGAHQSISTVGKDEFGAICID